MATTGTSLVSQRVTLTGKAQERGAFVITHSFLDANGDAVTPTALTWTLTDSLGNVINGKLDVTISPSSEVNIVLSGADLAVDDTNVSYFDLVRKLIFEGSYAHSTYGTLPIKDEITFSIENLTALTGTGT